MVMSRPVHVPSIFLLEMANVGVKTVAAKISKRPMNAIVAEWWNMQLMVDEMTMPRAWSTVMDLAVKHGLTAYDASYLELALRKNAILATLDNQLAAAARVEGLTVLPN